MNQEWRLDLNQIIGVSARSPPRKCGRTHYRSTVLYPWETFELLDKYEYSVYSPRTFQSIFPSFIVRWCISCAPDHPRLLIIMVNKWTRVCSLCNMYTNLKIQANTHHFSPRDDMVLGTSFVAGFDYIISRARNRSHHCSHKTPEDTIPRKRHLQLRQWGDRNTE